MDGEKKKQETVTFVPIYHYMEMPHYISSFRRERIRCFFLFVCFFQISQTCFCLSVIFFSQLPEKLDAAKLDTKHDKQNGRRQVKIVRSIRSETRQLPGAIKRLIIE